MWELVLRVQKIHKAFVMASLVGLIEVAVAYVLPPLLRFRTCTLLSFICVTRI